MQNCGCSITGRLMKSVKNETELKGFRNAMVKDGGVALVKFYMWLEKAVPTGGEVAETDIEKKVARIPLPAGPVCWRKLRNYCRIWY